MSGQEIHGGTAGSRSVVRIRFACMQSGCGYAWYIVSDSKQARWYSLQSVAVGNLIIGVNFLQIVGGAHGPFLPLPFPSPLLLPLPSLPLSLEVGPLKSS